MVSVADSRRVRILSSIANNIDVDVMVADSLRFLVKSSVCPLCSLSLSSSSLTPVGGGYIQG